MYVAGQAATQHNRIWQMRHYYTRNILSNKYLTIITPKERVQIIAYVNHPYEGVVSLMWLIAMSLAAMQASIFSNSWSNGKKSGLAAQDYQEH